MTNWPVRNDTPQEITVEQDSPLITNATSLFRNAVMELLGKFAAATNDTGTGPEAGSGINGGGGDDAETYGTQDNNMERYNDDVERNQRGGENDDEGTSSTPGSSNAGKSNTGNDQTSGSDPESDPDLLSPRGRTNSDEQIPGDPESPTETGEWWDPLVNWWNNLWKTTPDDTAPCACGGPSDTGPNDSDPGDPEISPGDPFVDPFFGGYRDHWQRQWYA